MGQKEVIIRKLPLPLQIKLGNDTIITDGFFRLTSREAKEIKITSISEDGYATIEIHPWTEQRSSRDISVIVEQDTFLGAAMSKSRGSGKELGQYKYYRKSDGSFYAIAFGKRRRKIKLGKTTDRPGRIATIAKVIEGHFAKREFTKKQITPLLPKRLSHGQMLKALLDLMHIIGYLEKREVPGSKGRLQELFKATDKLVKLLYGQHFLNKYKISPEQT